MGNDSIAKITTPTKLGSLDFLNSKKPLGGLNPHNPHFVTIGNNLAQIIINNGLRKHHKILDLGCGTGRLAKPLTAFLNKGKYYGYDINKKFIDYCSEQYGGSFKHCDISHDEYNENGKLKQLDTKLDYGDKSFDVVVAIAVFNHLWFAEIYHLVSEVSRILKPKGLFVCSFLLLNCWSREFSKKREKPPYSFKHGSGCSGCDNINRPLVNVAHDEEIVRRLFIKSKLMIKEPIKYGQWCESPGAIAGPDVLISTKI